MKRYTKDAKRVCDYLQTIATEIGCGDDPVGFLIASHAVLSSRNVAYQKARQRITLSAFAAEAQALETEKLGHQEVKDRFPARTRAEALYDALAELATVDDQ